MNLLEQGRKLGYTPNQIRGMVNQQKLFNEILECQNLEDVKILLMHWVETGKIR